MKTKLFAVLLLTVIAMSCDRDHGGPPPPTPSPPEPTEPAASGEELKAIDLVRDPLRWSAKSVVLDPTGIPVVFRGNTISWQDKVAPIQEQYLGWVGVKYNRMLDAELGLYDINAINASAGSRASLEGQMAVHAKKGEFPSNTRKWVISLERMLDAPSQNGAPISLPVFRFWRYAGGR
jgi:hypothetical protein